MKKKIFVVIDKRSMIGMTGLDKLVGESSSSVSDVELQIEVTLQGVDYAPVNEELRAMFPVVNRAFVNRVVVQY
jgi:hypothetical protein